MKKILTILFLTCFSLSQAQTPPQTQAQVNSGSYSPATGATTQATFLTGTIYVKMYNIGGRPVAVETNNSMLFTPNPVKDFLNFTKDSGIKLVMVYDLTGRKMLESKVENNAIDLSALPKGSYIMITDLDRSKGYKLLKE